MFDSKSIVELSPQQSASIPSWQQKWQRITFSTKSLNRKKAVQAIKVAYIAIGQPLPDIIFAPSPIAALDKMVTSKSMQQQIADLIKSISSLETYNENIARKASKLLTMATPPHGELARIFNDQIHRQLGDLNFNKLRHQLQLIAPEAKSQLKIYLANQLKSRLISQLVKGLEKQLGKEKSKLLREKLWLELDRQPGELLELQFLPDQGCWFDFAVSTLNCSLQLNQWQAFQQLALDCGAIYATEEYCIVCAPRSGSLRDRPARVHLRAKSQFEPVRELTLEFRDGSIIYSDAGDLVSPLSKPSQRAKSSQAEKKTVHQTKKKTVRQTERKTVPQKEKETIPQLSSREIKFLTLQQKALIPSYYQKWHDLILNPQEPELATIFQTIESAYSALGEEPPARNLLAKPELMLDAIFPRESIKSGLTNLHQYLSASIDKQLAKESGSKLELQEILQERGRVKKQLASSLARRLVGILNLPINKLPIYQLIDKLAANLDRESFDLDDFKLTIENTQLIEQFKDFQEIREDLKSRIIVSLLHQFSSYNPKDYLALEIINYTRDDLKERSIAVILNNLIRTAAWLDFCISELSFSVDRKQWRAFQHLAKYCPFTPIVNGKCLNHKLLASSNNSQIVKEESLVGKVTSSSNNKEQLEFPHRKEKNTRKYKLEKLANFAKELGIFYLHSLSVIFRIIYAPIKNTAKQLLLLGQIIRLSIPISVSFCSWIFLEILKLYNLILPLPSILTNRRLLRQRRLLISAKYGLDTERWQTKWLRTESNAEVRKTLIQGIGYERIYRELKSFRLDVWREYTLLRIDGSYQDLEPIVLLKMTCPSTKSIHLVRVPPNIRSAREAISWANWDVDPEKFVVET